jgi:short-subunit dehydrogenase
MKLSGRRVLLTGASRGIGAALARRMRERGANLALVARPSADLEQVASEVEGVAYPCDLADPDAVAGLAARVLADGPVDVLVNNAGISNVGWFADRTHDEVERVLRVNLLSPMHLTRGLLPHMLEQGRGHIVNMSSMAAVIAPPGLAAYGASKAGLSHFTAVLRADLRDEPINLTVVHLGSVTTDMDEEARSYGPLRVLAEQSKGRDITPMDVFVKRVVDAIERDRDEVRVPAMMAPLAALTHAPRALGGLMFRRAPSKELRQDVPR